MDKNKRTFLFDSKEIRIYYINNMIKNLDKLQQIIDSNANGQIAQMIDMIWSYNTYDFGHDLDTLVKSEQITADTGLEIARKFLMHRSVKSKNKTK